MNTALIIFISTVWVVTMAFLAWTVINLRSKLDQTQDRLWGEQIRRRRTEEQAVTLVEKVTPLIEQTDWMTGRWHGQHQTLVNLELKRNLAVVDARRALWDIPIVADHIRTTYGEQQK